MNLGHMDGHSVRGKTVLVTGGTGFIGGRLVEKLVLEHKTQVRALIRNFGTASRLARFPIEMIGGDIQDAECVQQAAQGCDIIFHCAHDARLTQGPQRQMAVQGTENVCRAVIKASASRSTPVRMVHVSTLSVYGPTADGELTEDTPWQPSKHPYVLAKRAAERLVLDLHQQEGLSGVVIQPTIVYGPFSKPWTIGPVNALQTGQVPLVDGGRGYCNAVYIDDVVDAMLLAATRPGIEGEVLLISGTEPISWTDFYRAFEDILGTHSTIDIAAEKLEEMWKQQQRDASTLTQIRKALWNGNTVRQMLRTPVGRTSLKLLKRVIPEEQRSILKSRVLPSRKKTHKPALPVGNGSGQTDVQLPRGPIHVPDETLLSLYRPQTRVRIDKARKLLGYEPHFGFERGMELTAQYIRWANLADTQRPADSKGPGE